jgi:hypothetical protein
MADNENEPQDEQKSKYKTSRGVNWSDVPWHELPGMVSDGKIAAALIEAGKQLPQED